MKSSDFDDFLEETFAGIRAVLSNKAAEYADEDRLANFKRAAALQKTSPIRALAGMLAKHTISLNDMMASDDPYDLDVWNEKTGDSINYLILLRALLHEHLYESSIEPDEKAEPATDDLLNDMFPGLASINEITHEYAKQWMDSVFGKKRPDEQKLDGILPDADEEQIPEFDEGEAEEGQTIHEFLQANPEVELTATGMPQDITVNVYGGFPGAAGIPQDTTVNVYGGFPSDEESERLLAAARADRDRYIHGAEQ